MLVKVKKAGPRIEEKDEGMVGGAIGISSEEDDLSGS